MRTVSILALPCLALASWGCERPVAPCDSSPCPACTCDGSPPVADDASPAPTQADSSTPTKQEGASAALVMEEDGSIKLLPPRRSAAGTLMEALSKRRSQRQFSDKQLPLEVLSDLLWTASGVNRQDNGRRTAPSAMNDHEIDVYVALVQGLFRYDADAHTLLPVDSQDIRALTGKQGFVATAPLNLVYVADIERMSQELSDEDKTFYSIADTGFISQNVYLHCANNGLATVVRGYIDRPALAQAMKLRPSQQIILSQTVGYPGDPGAE